MYCRNCGKQIPDQAKFCRYCGEPQAITADSPAAGVPAYQNNTQQAGYSHAPQPPAAYQPVPQPTAYQPSPQPARAATGTSFLFSHNCIYRVAPENELNKYEWGGIPEGTVDIYEDRLEFFKKNKMLTMTLGALGSALNGKGKLDVVVPGYLVRRDTVENKKNDFRFLLTDGRAVRLTFLGFSLKPDIRDAMFRFLNP